MAVALMAVAPLGACARGSSPAEATSAGAAAPPHRFGAALDGGAGPSFSIYTLSSQGEVDGSFAVTFACELTANPNSIVPNPAARSVVPNIALADLLLLRTGAVVEQVLTTTPYPPGTQQATIDADLLSRCQAAQALLANANPALSGVVNRAYNGSAWSALTATVPTLPQTNFGQPILLDVEHSTAFGYLPGIVSQRAQGYVSTAATTGTRIRATTYAPPGTGAQRSLVSSSASDSAAGTGAQTVEVDYLTSALVAKSEVDTMNGVTAVATQNTDIAFLERMFVKTSGSGQTNAGTITLGTTASGGSAIASIAVNDAQTFYAHHYVPAGVTAYLLNVSGGASVDAGRVFITAQNPTVSTSPALGIGGIYPHLAGGNEDHSFSVPLAVTGPNYVFLTEQPNASTASVAFGEFEYIQF